jgi:uncharacterized membrane protein (UPF0127 family)
MLYVGNKDIPFDVKIADTFLKRLLGLMGKKELNEEGLAIKPCNGIHTCFMRFPIDCLYLDVDEKIIRMETMKPWKIGKIIKNCKTVIELPEGTIQKFKLNLNEVVQIKER